MPGGDLLLGLILPLTGPSAGLAHEELNGIQIAMEEVNRAGGAAGKQIRLLTRDVDSREATAGAVNELKQEGATIVMGSYDSSLSIPAAHAASAAGMVYWETGSVADQLTGEGLPHVFRVGPAGSNLGSGSALFAATQLATRLGKAPSQLRLSVVQVDDAYGHSVAAAALSRARQLGFAVAGPATYVAWHPDWDRVFAFVAASRPDILVLASHVPDGIAFRREMLARGIRVKALIGSTMAECGPDFGRALGADAVGIFASDRPTSGFQPRGPEQRRPSRIPVAGDRLPSTVPSRPWRGGDLRVLFRLGPAPLHPASRHCPRHNRHLRSGDGPGHPRGQPPQRQRPAVLAPTWRPGTEPALRQRHLAVAGSAKERDGVARAVRHRPDRNGAAASLTASSPVDRSRAHDPALAGIGRSPGPGPGAGQRHP